MPCRQGVRQIAYSIVPSCSGQVFVRVASPFLYYSRSCSIDVRTRNRVTDWVQPRFGFFVPDFSNTEFINIDYCMIMRTSTPVHLSCTRRPHQLEDI
jgi:hypothetical protein